MFFTLPEIEILHVDSLKEIQVIKNSALLTVGDISDEEYFDKLKSLDEQIAKLLAKTDKKNKNVNWKINFPHDLKFESLFVSLAASAEKNFFMNKYASELANNIQNSEIKNLYIQSFFDDKNFNRNLLTAFFSYLYTFNIYKKEESEKKIEKIFIIDSNNSISESMIADIKAVISGMNFTKDLGNEPANVLHPVEYAKRIEKEFNNTNVKVHTFGRAEMEKMGMGGLIGVAIGSVIEPKMVILEYNGNPKSNEKISFIGKGVTFDTGGISIKPSAGMEDMKFDMCGSATVVGLMKTLAERNAKVNVIGAVGLVENMPSGSAQRPGDIVKTMSGKTVEVLNTDAEGRMVLADVLWYVQDKYKPKMMVDLATLTGAVLVALGMEYAGLFSNNADLIQQISQASEKTGEKVWHLPLAEEYRSYMKSKVADLQNISNQSGYGPGSTTAALFLEEFVNEVPWVHLDIAGVAARRDNTATGFGVALLNQMIADNYEEK